MSELNNTGGLYRYITKPWDPDELIEVLSDAAKRFERDAARLEFVADVKSFADEVMQLAESIAAGPDNTLNMPGLIDRAKSIATQSNVLL